MEGQYYSADSKTNASGHWFKAAVALVGGSSLLLLAVTASTSNPVFQQDSLADLVGISSSKYPVGIGGQRLRPACAIQTNKNAAALFKKYGIAQDPVAKFAIASIAVNPRSVVCRHGEAELTPEEAEKQKIEIFKSMGRDADGNIIQEVEEIKEEVVLKAKDMAGVTPPFGLFDPLGFSTDVPAGRLLFYREVEIKHGRVGMLASIGFLVAEHFHPLFGGNIDVPSYIAFQQTPLQKFWPAVLALIAIPELMSVDNFEEPSSDNDSLFAMKTDTGLVPGALGFDPLNLWPVDKKEQLELQNKELNNGRLAMLAAAGMVAQELVTGQKLF